MAVFMRINTILTEIKRPILNELNRSEFSRCHPYNSYRYRYQIPAEQTAAWGPGANMDREGQSKNLCSTRACRFPFLTQELLRQKKRGKKIYEIFPRPEKLGPNIMLNRTT